jgi:hypothetical protein
MIYLDNGPIASSHVFQQVMRYTLMSVTARSKGKVERPFRTVKKMHDARDPLPLSRAER